MVVSSFAGSLEENAVQLIVMRNGKMILRAEGTMMECHQLPPRNIIPWNGKETRQVQRVVREWKVIQIRKFCRGVLLVVHSGGQACYILQRLERPYRVNNGPVQLLHMASGA